MWCGVSFLPFYSTHSAHLEVSRLQDIQPCTHLNSLLSKLLSCIGIVNWPVFGCWVLRGSPGPSMGWSARNIRAWSKALTTKCSRSFSSDRSAWKTKHQKHKDKIISLLYFRMQSKSDDPDKRIYNLVKRTSCSTYVLFIEKEAIYSFPLQILYVDISSSCLLMYAVPNELG